MEIATTSNALHLFPKNRRVKTKGVRYNFIDFSDASSLLPVNPKSDLDKSQSLSQTRRDGQKKYDVVVAPKKRQRSGEENPPQKKQKKTETKTKVTKSVDVKAVTRKITKPENSTTASSKAHLHETAEKKPEGIDLRNLITKAQHKIQEKRQIDHPREDIARQRIAARIALNQMVATVSFDHHLDYHRELEQLGYTFIHDQVECLKP